jgi:RNA polymerase sigma factor (sigma-70 family)
MLSNEHEGEGKITIEGVDTLGSVARSLNVEPREAQLIARIVDGDLQAFDALYRIYFPRLKRFLDRMTRSATLIEEILNDTMLVVWQKAATYNGSCKVSTWIFSIAYRKALKALRDVDDPIDMDFDQISAEENGQPDQEYNQRQSQMNVGRALDALPLEQRTVVNLTYYHGMDYREIAETMDCPVNTVKTRMFHARKRLKILLSSVMG